ncbi:RpiR family transcriptional regulator [Cupriavidus sp. USMAA2-4]|uniref:RpiR family transcriptional regulator n=1 Tax=Cupriavidus malaysiensis TaxID=367825 RepID=A0ABN4TLA5_9BURK|nr:MULTISPECIES: MurR/RpiR family transcriptional regulator [Cupriavidus]AOY92129.1 RpiR family transcriptional regulator [Cupriavidus sp. USMAA2-4]AOY98313.1 RpiR family transcriptional regulator [Cupriavidus sp. USMAHM13]AOZ04744.1 RpiR family transcriptional regulator [Cupriavidus malaysiensis]
MSTHEVLEALEARIRQRYGDLSAADRKLADVLLARQRELLSYSATELAGLAGVSKASAARFFRRLGYADFSAFRQNLRDQVSARSPLRQLERGGPPSAARGAPSARSGLAAHVERDALRLAALPEQVGERALGAALDALAEARRVWVVGYRNSYLVAMHACALLSQGRPDVAMLNDAAGQDAERIAEIEPRDVLLAVDFRRRAQRLPAVVGLAREAGAGCILLTDTPVSTLAAEADAVLGCAHQGEQVFDSYVAAVSLVNYLATAVVTRTRKRARARMQRIERAHAVLADLEGLA